MTGKRFFAGVVVLGLLILFTLPVNTREGLRIAIRKNLAPIQNLIGGGRGIGETSVSLMRPGVLLERNRALEEQVGNLRFEMTQIETLKQENLSLRQALELKQRTPQPLILCNVTTRGEISGWWQTLTLDRGFTHGIRSGMPVLTPEGVVGRTQHVTAYNSEVLLLTDPVFQLSCRTARSGLLGIVQGQGVSLSSEESFHSSFALAPCHLDLVARSAPLEEGEPVLTSGLGGVFPPDLIVGYVSEPALDESKLFQTAEIVPAVPMDRLDRVFVMLNRRAISNVPPEAALSSQTVDPANGGPP